MNNFPGNATIKSIVPVATVDADANGSSIDMAEYDDNVALVLSASAGTGDMTLDVKLQGSANGSTGWADIAGAAFAQVTTTASVQKIIVNVASQPRYMRAVLDVGGTTPSFIVAVNALGEPKYIS